MLYGHTHDSIVAHAEEQYIRIMNWLGIPLHAFNVSACRLNYEPQTLEEILERAGEIQRAENRVL